ncbi:MAG: response regulator [Pseudobutyrivibrio sp.]|nr:response regulator [Pseudobutyrivibrio sp.]
MDLNNTKILICDDSVLSRKQVMDAVNSFAEGATYIEAKNGDEAVALYKEHHPHLVFMDIVMPEKDGTTALSEIISYDSDALVIVISSIGTQGQLKMAIENGAKDFIQKPIDRAQLKRVLEARLRLGGN